LFQLCISTNLGAVTGAVTGDPRGIQRVKVCMYVCAHTQGISRQVSNCQNKFPETAKHTDEKM